MALADEGPSTTPYPRANLGAVFVTLRWSAAKWQVHRGNVIPDFEVNEFLIRIATMVPHRKGTVPDKQCKEKSGMCQLVALPFQSTAR